MPRGRKVEPKGRDWPPEKTLRFLEQQLNELQKFRGRSWRDVEHEEEEWQQFTASVIIHGFGGESQNLGNYNMARWAGVQNMMGISDHQRQLNFQERIEEFQAVLKSSIRELEAELPEPDVRAAVAVQGPATAETTARTNLLVLISHSSKDASLAGELTEFVRAGLALSPNQIRCSSVDGYRLPAGVKTDDQLRMEVNDVRVLIGLITRNSLSSPYVLFELGARWGAGLFMVPLLAGVTPEEVRGPLSGLNALSCSVEAQLHQMLADMSKRLEMPLQSAASYLRYLKTVKVIADALNVVPAAPAPKNEGGAGAGALAAAEEARPPQVLGAGNVIDPDTYKVAAERWKQLKEPAEREAIRLLLREDLTTDQVLNFLNQKGLAVNSYGLLERIEDKTNFVQRVLPGEHLHGYRGPWTVNPKYKLALQRLLEQAPA
jgi:hypothetical protein